MSSRSAGNGPFGKPQTAHAGELDRSRSWCTEFQPWSRLCTAHRRTAGRRRRGDWGKANIEAYVKPFQAETGIKVTSIVDDSTLAQVELMVTTKNVAVDVMDLSANSTRVASGKGYLEEIDYSTTRKRNSKAS